MKIATSLCYTYRISADIQKVKQSLSTNKLIFEITSSKLLYYLKYHGTNNSIFINNLKAPFLKYCSFLTIIVVTELRFLVTEKLIYFLLLIFYSYKTSCTERVSTVSLNLLVENILRSGV